MTLQIGDRVVIKPAPLEPNPANHTYTPGALLWRLNQNEALGGEAGVIDHDTTYSFSGGFYRIKLDDSTKGSTAGWTWVAEEWVERERTAKLIAAIRRLKSTLPAEIHPAPVDDRRFDGFCDPCGGFRKHKRMCPVGRRC